MKDIADADYAKQYTEWHIKTGGYARDMTLRDHLAGLALQSILVEIECGPDDIKHVAASAYIMADAMLKERAK